MVKEEKNKYIKKLENMTTLELLESLFDDFKLLKHYKNYVIEKHLSSDFLLWLGEK